MPQSHLVLIFLDFNVCCDGIYYRTLCKYPGKNISFHVTEGSTVYWFSILIEYEDGDGDVGAVHLKQVCAELG
jgi:hypothetical protein